MSPNVLVASRSDPAAFGQFYRDHADRLLRFFYKRTRDTEVAADLTAETFATALDRLDRYDPAKGEPVQWLFGIAKNQLHAFWRHQHVDDTARRKFAIPREPLDQATADALTAVDTAIDNAAVLSLIDALPARMNTAVRLRVLDQLSYADIGRELGTTVGNARVLVHRGLGRLDHQGFDE